MSSTTIWKYTLVPGAQPCQGSRVIHVGCDLAHEDLPTVWMEVDPDRDEKRTLMFIGTGFKVPPHSTHVGSMITPARFVWHVYDVTALFPPQDYAGEGT